MKPLHRNTLRTALVTVLGAASLAAGGAAFAQHHHGGGFGPGAMMPMHGAGGMGMGPMGAADPARMQARSNERIQRMLSQVGASDAQIKQVQSIWSAAFTDLAAISKERQTSRQTLRGLFSAPTIDARAIEDARKAQMALADRQSQRMTQAMTDAAQVLDPQQRAKLAELMQSRGAGRGGHHHGGPRRGPAAGASPQAFVS